GVRASRSLCHQRSGHWMAGPSMDPGGRRAPLERRSHLAPTLPAFFLPYRPSLPHQPYVSRFAPAPTGLLHLGHLVNALFVWGVTRAIGGRILLRIEDHDRQRSRAGFERAILDDLDWLGFVPDEPTTDDFRCGVCPGRQSDRESTYKAALEGLRKQGLVYGCSCSRSDISGGAPSTGEAPYPGTCRAKGLVDGPELTTRVRLDATVERFDDLLRGPQEQRPDQQCGDLIARDRAGNWSYQFAAAVDDLDQNITMVIRGDD